LLGDIVKSKGLWGQIAQFRSRRLCTDRMASTISIPCLSGWSETRVQAVLFAGFVFRLYKLNRESAGKSRVQILRSYLNQCAPLYDGIGFAMYGDTAISDGATA
jgi:hypothetical protein